MEELKQPQDIGKFKQLQDELTQVRITIEKKIGTAQQNKGLPSKKNITTNNKTNFRNKEKIKENSLNNHDYFGKRN